MEGAQLVSEARAFAIKMHEGQTRSNKAKQPYWQHVEAVARLVEDSGGTHEEIAAAWLHDTVEDADVTIAEIDEKFGPAVAEIVDGLTDKPDLSGLPTLERKTLQAERVRNKSDSVKRVKIADQTDNVGAIAVDPPSLWKIQKCSEYVHGANLIAQECNGVSTYLDQKFEENYKKASAIYPQ